MTDRTAVNRASRMAALLALVALLLGALPVQAASSIQMEVRPLVGGRYEAGGWLALSVTLVNDGEPTDGFLSAETSEGTVRRFVEMPAGARKVVTLYVQPDAFARRVEVIYDEPNGTVAAEVEVRIFEQSVNQYAVVGDATGTLRPQMVGSDQVGSVPEPISIAPGDIPERPEPLDGLSAMVWAGDSSTLTEAQRQSVQRWVAGGGQLIVLGGPDWQARAGGLADLLPVEELAAHDGVPQARLAAWAGSDAPPEPEATVSAGTLVDGARALVAADDGTILASMRAIGAGRVVFVGTDLANDEHRGWAGAPGLWSRILPSGAAIEQFMGGGFPIEEEIQSAFSRALDTLPSLEVPPAELLLAVIVGYILLIGPISYAVLRRADRRELAWVTAPLLVVLFSASSYGIGRTLKGSDVIVNQISLIRSTSAGASATVETYAGVYSPDRSTYDVTVDGDVLLSRLVPPERQGFGQSGPGVVVEQGDPVHLRGLSIGVFGFEGVRAVGVVDYQPALSITWSTREGDYVGTVTNNGEAPMSDVAWISPSGGELIGDLEPGATEEFTIPGTNFNGSSASDQVYGFGGFESSTQEQRRIQMRRTVIDALVGYGGFGPVGLAPGGGARGPYVIGWTADEGLLPVTVDDQRTQRYASSVEVITARPSLGTGEVTIQPGQMAINVIATDGDASSAGPGMVSLGSGSATFGVALPLDAANLAPTEVEILVGPDPSIVMGDPGSFGGFWPEGYTVELRQPGTDEWVLLGDLSERSSFDVDDPATALSSTGRIEVRISGTLNQNFGAPSVFVSARVSGVIDE